MGMWGKIAYMVQLLKLYHLGDFSVFGVFYSRLWGLRKMTLNVSMVMLSPNKIMHISHRMYETLTFLAGCCFHFLFPVVWRLSKTQCRAKWWNAPKCSSWRLLNAHAFLQDHHIQEHWHDN